MIDKVSGVQLISTKISGILYLVNTGPKINEVEVNTRYIFEWCNKCFQVLYLLLEKEILLIYLVNMEKC